MASFTLAHGPALWGPRAAVAASARSRYGCARSARGCFEATRDEKHSVQSIDEVLLASVAMRPPRFGTSDHPTTLSEWLIHPL